MKILTIPTTKEEKKLQKLFEKQFKAEKNVVEFTICLFNGKRKKVFGYLDWDNHKIFLDEIYNVSSMIAITDKKHNTYKIKEININGGKYLIETDDQEEHFKVLHEIVFD